MFSNAFKIKKSNNIGNTFLEKVTRYKRKNQCKIKKINKINKKYKK